MLYVYLVLVEVIVLYIYTSSAYNHHLGAINSMETEKYSVRSIIHLPHDKLYTDDGIGCTYVVCWVRLKFRGVLWCVLYIYI